MILHELAERLTAADIGATVYLGTMPDDPDDVCALYLAGGGVSVMSLDGGGVEAQSFSVSLRSASGDGALSRAQAVLRLLDGYSGGGVLRVGVRSGFENGGRDARGRSILTAQFDAKVEKSGGA